MIQGVLLLLAGLIVLFPRSPKAQDLVGEWKGTYVCEQKSTGITLDVSPSKDGAANEASFAFYPLEGKSDKSNSGQFGGSLSVYANEAGFVPKKWFTNTPPGYGMIGFDAEVSGDKMKGHVNSSGCSTILLTRMSSDAPVLSGIDKYKFRIQTAGSSSLGESYEGTWDGAIYDSNSSLIRQRLTLLVNDEGKVSYVDRNNVERREELVLQSNNSVYGFAPSTYPYSLAYFYVEASKSITVEPSGLAYWHMTQPRGNSNFPAVYAFRRTNTSVVPPKSSLDSWCRTHSDPWFEDRRDYLRRAISLKTKYFAELSDYKPLHMSLLTVLLDDVFERRFGKPLSLMSEDEYGRTMLQVRQCALTSSDVNSWMRDGLLDGVLDTQVLSQEISSMHPPFMRQPFVPDASQLLSRTQALQMIAPVGDAEAQVDAVVQRARSTTDLTSFEQVFRQNAPKLSLVRPDVLGRILFGIDDKRNILIEVVASSSAASRRQRAEDRMKGITIPIVPDEERQALHDLVYGKNPKLTIPQRAFIAAMTDSIVNGCYEPGSLPEVLSIGDRLALASFINEAGVRNASPNSSELNMMTQATVAMRANGCDSSFSAAFLQALAEYLQSEMRDSLGGQSLFIRSCISQGRGQEQCSCLANKLRTTIPNVNDIQFSREVLYNNKNAVLGLEMLSECKLTDE